MKSVKDLLEAITQHNSSVKKKSHLFVPVIDIEMKLTIYEYNVLKTTLTEDINRNGKEHLDVNNACRNILNKMKARPDIKHVTVEVTGGIAEVTKCPANTLVKIIDHDNEKQG